ncbi:MAG: VWA domain-containing protein, partial [Oscillospiraceae bacterium]|nr:VWA domain-containing protein [Oscillospiraceae bacterium]
MKKMLKKLTALAAAAVMCLAALPCADISAASVRTITTITNGNGTISASSTSLAPGESYTLTATPNPGYEFDHWEIADGGSTVGVKNANIAFVIDVSGSMNTYIKKVRSNLENFINEVSKENITINMSFITYGNNGSKSKPEKNAVYYTYADGSKWSSDTAGAVDILDRILAERNQGSYEMTCEAFRQLLDGNNNLTFPSSINNYVFLLTDEDCDEYSKASDTATDTTQYSLAKWSSIFAQNNVRVSVVAEDSKECHLGGYNGSGYDEIVTNTQGTYININTNDYYKLMLDYAKFIGETVVTVNQTYYTNPCTAVMPDCDIIAEAIFTSNGAPVQQTYNVTVITDGYGTAYASQVSALPGQQINIIAIPDSGNMLDSITSNDVKINVNSFRMPEKDVTVY